MHALEPELRPCEVFARLVAKDVFDVLTNNNRRKISRRSVPIDDRGGGSEQADKAILRRNQHLTELLACGDVGQKGEPVRLTVGAPDRDAVAEASERTVRPLCLAYFGPVWMLSAWCELREDFRTFRLDRIDGFEVQADRFRLEPGKTLHDFLKRDQTWTRGYGTRPSE